MMAGPEPLGKFMRERWSAGFDMHDFEFQMGEVEPAGLLVVECPLLLEPLQARVVRVQPEGLVEEIRAVGLQAVHYCQKL